MNKRPTLADVAQCAGVSKTTASLALNGKGLDKIPAATRQRVLAAAATLEFRPHGVARALVRRRADVLGIICTLNPFVEMAHHAFEQALLSVVFYHALERGYNPMIYAVPDDEAQERFPRYADGRSDAFLLLYPPPNSPLVKYLHGQGMPTVSLCCRESDPAARWVDSDNEGGIRLAVTHLIAQGHRRIAYLIGPEVEDNAHTRIVTFRAVLQEHGLPARADWIVPYTWDEASTQQQIDRFFADAESPTALLTWNDFAAGEVYKALNRRGLRIPEDVSVVGFDDIPSARAAVPPLTTVRQDVVQMGRAAVDLAIDACCGADSPESPRSVLCPVSLVARQSTAPPLS